MSQESFAAVSVATAVICGVFFYPPPPPARSRPAAAIRVLPAASVATAAVQPAALSMRTPGPVTRIQAAIRRTGLIESQRPMAPPAAEPKGNAT